MSRTKNMNAVFDYYEDEVIATNDAPNNRHWADYGGVHISVNAASKELDSGAYNVLKTNDGKLYLRAIKLHSDNLLITEDCPAAEALREIQAFWNDAGSYHKHGFLHRRGFLFYGAPGNGKTALVNLVVRNVVDAGGLVVMFSPMTCDAAVDIVRMIRGVEPDRRILCIFEDIDQMVDRNAESLLSLLDGEDAADHVINIATTNYLEKLPERIKSRPRRFDRVVEILAPSEPMRRAYFTQKLKIKEGKKLDRYIKASAGFSYAGLADLVISVECLKQPFQSAAARLRTMLRLSAVEEAAEEGIHINVDENLQVVKPSGSVDEDEDDE